MKSKATALDEIKSVFLLPAKQDFIAEAISPTAGGFHPSQTDLTGVILQTEYHAKVTVSFVFLIHRGRTA